MVRVYKRKSAREQYGMDNLHAKVSSGEISKRKAEAVFGMPLKTLMWHLKARLKSRVLLDDLNLHWETTMRRLWLIMPLHYSNVIWLDHHRFKKLAFDIAKKLGLPHPFNKDNKMAGKDWLV